MRHIDSAPDRVMLSDSGDEDDGESVDTTLTVERDTILAQNDLVEIDYNGGVNDPGSESIRWGRDHYMYRTVSQETFGADLQPHQSIERDLRGDGIVTQSVEQHTTQVASQSENLSAPSHSLAESIIPPQISVSLGTPVQATPPPTSDFEMAATLGSPAEQEEQATYPGDGGVLQLISLEGAAEVPVAVVGIDPTSAPGPCVGIDDASAQETDSAISESHFVLDGNNPGISNNIEDSRPRRGPSAKKRISVKEYKRSYPSSARGLRDPPQPPAGR